MGAGQSPNRPQIKIWEASHFLEIPTEPVICYSLGRLRVKPKWPLIVLCAPLVWHGMKSFCENATCQVFQNCKKQLLLQNCADLHYFTEELLSHQTSTIVQSAWLTKGCFVWLTLSAVRLAAAVLYQVLDHGSIKVFFTHCCQMLTIPQEWGVGKGSDNPALIILVVKLCNPHLSFGE